MTRQKIASRVVYKQSPLECNVKAVCSWNSILFQTVLATNNLVRSGEGFEELSERGHGIGKDGAKVLVDALHRSGICTMARKLLTNKSFHDEEGGGFEKEQSKKSSRNNQGLSSYNRRKQEVLRLVSWRPTHNDNLLSAPHEIITLA